MIGIRLKNGSKVHTAESGQTRCIGELRFYAVLMNVDTSHQEIVIVPESAFFNSNLGSLLLDDELISI